MVASFLSRVLSFLGRQRPVVFHCYTTSVEAMTYAPIQRSSKFIPAWWQELAKNKSLFDTSMKNCAGFKYLYEKSFTIPMWTEFDVMLDQTSSASQVGDLKTRVDLHSADQRGTFAPEEKNLHLKLVSPWIICCNEEVYCSWVPATWNNNDMYNIQVLPAVVEYKYQHDTHVNILIKREPEQKHYRINVNQPLVHIAPMTDRKFKVVLHLVSEKEYQERQMKFMPVLVAKYEKTKKHLQQCPHKFSN